MGKLLRLVICSPNNKDLRSGRSSIDLGESLHLQSDARLAVYKIRLADSFLSTDRGRYLLGRRLARHAELGAAAQGRLYGRHLQQDHEQPERRLRRQPAHPEWPGAAPAIS